MAERLSKGGRRWCFPRRSIRSTGRRSARTSPTWRSRSSRSPSVRNGATDAAALAAGDRREDLRGGGAVAQLLRHRGGLGRRFGCGAREGSPRARRRRRGRVARAAGFAGGKGHGHRVRRGAVARGPDARWRPRPRFPGLPDGTRASDPGSPRRANARLRGTPRLLSDALDPRAAHPARKGDLEHLHQPGTDGARREHPHVASGKAGLACRRPAEPREGGISEGQDLRASRVPASVPGARPSTSFSSKDRGTRRR